MIPGLLTVFWVAEVANPKFFLNGRKNAKDSQDQTPFFATESQAPARI